MSSSNVPALINHPTRPASTCRNQPQYGTHTASMGAGILVNRLLVNLFDTGISGLVQKILRIVDKQDDGAAR